MKNSNLFAALVAETTEAESPKKEVAVKKVPPKKPVKKAPVSKMTKRELLAEVERLQKIVEQKSVGEELSCSQFNCLTTVKSLGSPKEEPTSVGFSKVTDPSKRD
jgi:hypothetical protein